jgi:hypothetical protein
MGFLAWRLAQSGDGAAAAALAVLSAGVLAYSTSRLAELTNVPVLDLGHGLTTLVGYVLERALCFL